MNKRLLWTLVIVWVLVVVGAAILSIHRTRIHLAEEKEAARLQQADLTARIEKLIPKYNGGTVSQKDSFELLNILEMNMFTGSVSLRDRNSGMNCTGSVFFGDGPNGGHFDTLVVSKCYDPLQRTRTYRSGVLLKDDPSNTY